MANNNTLILDFRDPTKYLYNSDLVDFTEYAATLKDLVDPSVKLGAKWNDYTHANYGDNEAINFDPTIIGDVIISNDKAAFIGGQISKELTFNFLKSMSDFMPQGTIKFNFFPNYSGNPSSSQDIVQLFSQNDSVNNSLKIVHSSTGDFVFYLYDITGNQLHADTLTYPIVNANESIEILISFQYALVEGVNKFYLNHYINGQKFKSYIYDANLFDIDNLLGISFGSPISYPNFSLNNLLLLDTYSDLGDSYTPGYEVVNSRFTTSPQKIEPKESITIETIDNITPLVNDEEPNYYVRYTFQLDDIEYFFDRQDLTWKVKEDVNQVSELSYMLQYKDQLPLSGKKFKVIPYLVTIAGDNSPGITSLVITYDEYVCCTEYTPSALVYGYVKDVLGNPIGNAQIKITPSKSSVATLGNYILPKYTQVIRSGLVNGYWDAMLALSNTFNPEITYNFEVYIRGELLYNKNNVQINQEGTIKFDELL